MWLARVVEASVRGKRVEKAGDVQRSVHGRDNEVEASRELLQRTWLLGIVDEMRSKLAGLGFLAVAGCEGVNLTAPFIRELQGHVAQAANTNDTNARGGPGSKVKGSNGALAEGAA
jgi:hypothetical protein